MILYESATLPHGRPFALKGDRFTSAFCHFQPKGWDFVEDTDGIPYSPTDYKGIVCPIVVFRARPVTQLPVPLFFLLDDEIGVHSLQKSGLLINIQLFRAKCLHVQFAHACMCGRRRIRQAGSHGCTHPNARIATGTLQEFGGHRRKVVLARHNRTSAARYLSPKCAPCMVVVNILLP